MLLTAISTGIKMSAACLSAMALGGRFRQGRVVTPIAYVLQSNESTEGEVPAANAGRSRNTLAQSSAQRHMATTKKKRGKAKSEDVVIPDKLYFRIGEVSKLAKLPAYVLRFWETEFPQLRPNKGSTGQRMYRRRDVENTLLIKKLLYEDGYTIAGAREKLRADMKSGKDQVVLPFTSGQPNTVQLKRVRQELSEILRLLDKSSHKRRAD